MPVQTSNSTRASSPKVEIARLLDCIVALMAEATPAEVMHRIVVNSCHQSADDTQTVILHIENGNMAYTIVKQPLQERTTLSPREQEIVYLVSNGLPNKGIARKLAISQHTVNTHVRRIFDKLGVNSRAEMVAYAWQSGLVAQSAHYN